MKLLSISIAFLFLVGCTIAIEDKMTKQKFDQILASMEKQIKNLEDQETALYSDIEVFYKGISSPYNFDSLESMDGYNELSSETQQNLKEEILREHEKNKDIMYEEIRGKENDIKTFHCEIGFAATDTRRFIEDHSKFWKDETVKEKRKYYESFSENFIGSHAYKKCKRTKSYLPNELYPQRGDQSEAQ